MSRSKWSIVFGSLAALSLLMCQNLARGDELQSAPQPPDGALRRPGRPPKVALPRNPRETDNSCGQQGCEGDCCVNRTWIVDIDAVFLAPIQHQNFGFVAVGTANEQGTGLDPVTDESTIATADFTLSPRITLGRQGDCWGFLARYWRMETGDVGSGTADTTGTGSFGNAVFGRDGRPGSDPAVGRRGLFRQHVSRLSSASATPSCGSRRPDVRRRYARLRPLRPQGSVLAKHDFSGVGVTFALQGFHQVNCSNFHLFYDLRASFIFDNNSSDSVATSAQAVVPTRAGGYALGYDFTQATANATNANMFIGEVQLGGQWDLPLKCVPANAFVRVAFEYQYWATNNAGGISDFAAAGQVGGPAVLAYGNSSGNTHVDLVGFNIGAGLTW